MSCTTTCTSVFVCMTHFNTYIFYPIYFEMESLIAQQRIFIDDVRQENLRLKMRVKELERKLSDIKKIVSTPSTLISY